MDLSVIYIKHFRNSLTCLGVNVQIMFASEKSFTTEGRSNIIHTIKKCYSPFQCSPLEICAPLNEHPADVFGNDTAVPFRVFIRTMNVICFVPS